MRVEDVKCGRRRMCLRGSGDLRDELPRGLTLAEYLPGRRGHRHLSEGLQWSDAALALPP